MSHHYENLLINMPVRHMMTMMETNSAKLSQQLQRFVSMEILNFFILARYNRNNNRDINDKPHTVISALRTSR